MATKHGRVIASLDGLLPIMSHDPLIIWPCKIRSSRTGGGSACKRLSRHRLLVLFYREGVFIFDCMKKKLRRDDFPLKVLQVIRQVSYLNVSSFHKAWNLNKFRKRFPLASFI